MAERKGNLKKAYEQWVARWKGDRPLDQAMHLAIGGEFETMGAIECDILRHFGLASTGYLIDVGCGSGRLAKPLSSYLKGRYLGIDIVPDSSNMRGRSPRGPIGASRPSITLAFLNRTLRRIWSVSFPC